MAAISMTRITLLLLPAVAVCGIALVFPLPHLDRKSTRLNSSHSQISYAVFCLKKKKNRQHRYALPQADFAAALAQDPCRLVHSNVWLRLTRSDQHVRLNFRNWV